MMPDPEFYAECLRESLVELIKDFKVDGRKPRKDPKAGNTEPRKKVRAKKTTKKKKIRKSSIKSEKVSAQRA